MKSERQKTILRLISEEFIDTQTELVEKLNKLGYKATQATISRDIKELGLVKVPAGDQRYRYASPPEHKISNVYGRLRRMFQDSVVGFEDSENLILIRTLPGTAHAVASCIDNIGWKEIIGTVAGDDTVLIVVKPKHAVKNVMENFWSLVT